MAVKPIPDGYHTITPYITTTDARVLIAFLKQAFDGTAIEHLVLPDGSIGHAEVTIGDSKVMISQARGQWKAMPCILYLYARDVDAIYKKALGAGATSISEPKDQFYGDRHGGVTDPTGNYWWIATHIEDISPEEMKRRSEAFMKQQAGT
jgi:PhnB protein